MLDTVGRPARLAATLSLLALAGCGLGGPAYGPASTAEAVVEMTNDLSFRPEVVRIRAGQTVEWRNTSLLAHTVTADARLADDPADVALPQGAEPFRAEVPAGEVFRRTFTVPGTYRYFCEPHEGLDMLGEIEVTA